jgi:hypothetical protein
MKKRTLIKYTVGFLVGKTILSCFGCSDTGSDPDTDENQAPETEITTQFKEEDGTVNYTVKGTDSDGSIDYITVNTNGNYQTVPNNSTINVSVIEGNNTITATACDNEGKADPTPATETNYSPTEQEASNLIAQTLNPSTYNKLDKDVSVALGDNPLFVVNAAIRKLNDTDAVIDYLGTHKDLLTLYGIPNISINRTSMSEIERKVLEFQDNGYN